MVPPAGVRHDQAPGPPVPLLVPGAADGREARGPGLDAAPALGPAAAPRRDGEAAQSGNTPGVVNIRPRHRGSGGGGGGRVWKLLNGLAWQHSLRRGGVTALVFASFLFLAHLLEVSPLLVRDTSQVEVKVALHEVPGRQLVTVAQEGGQRRGGEVLVTQSAEQRRDHGGVAHLPRLLRLGDQLDQHGLIVITIKDNRIKY